MGVAGEVGGGRDSRGCTPSSLAYYGIVLTICHIRYGISQ